MKGASTEQGETVNASVRLLSFTVAIELYVVGLFLQNFVVITEL